MHLLIVRSPASALAKGFLPKEACGYRIKTVRSALVALPVFVGLTTP